MEPAGIEASKRRIGVGSALTTLVNSGPSTDTCQPWLVDLGPAEPGAEPEVVVAVGPAFGVHIQQTLSGLNLSDVLAAMLAGIEDEGLPWRVVRVHHTSDCAFIGHAGAQLSGSGVSIGIQSKGTTVIHQRGLAPLENLELFSMSPNLDLAAYRQIGRNAARYADYSSVDARVSYEWTLPRGTLTLHGELTNALDRRHPC